VARGRHEAGLGGVRVLGEPLGGALRLERRLQLVRSSATRCSSVCVASRSACSVCLKSVMSV